MAKPPSRRSDRHIDGVKRRLSSLDALSARTAEAEKKILDAANDRLVKIQFAINKLHPRTAIDPAARDEFLDLMEEAHQLTMITERARGLIS